MDITIYESFDHSVAVLGVDTQVLEANYRRAWLLLQNVSTSDDIYLGLGRAITSGTGLILRPGGSLLLDMISTPWYGDVHAFAGSGNPYLVVIEVLKR